MTSREHRRPRWFSPAACMAIVLALVVTLHRVTLGFEVWTLEGWREQMIATGGLQAAPVPLLPADPHALALPWRGDPDAPAATLVDFVYTRCPGVCSALGSEFQQMQRQLQGDPARPAVRLVSVSFDLGHDDLPRLGAAARRFRADPALWTWARPRDETDLQALLRSLWVVAVPDGQGGFVHNGDIHLLDRQGRLVALFAYDEWPRALDAARRLASPTAAAPVPAPAARGERS